MLQRTALTVPDRRDGPAVNTTTVEMMMPEDVLGLVSTFYIV